MAERWTYLLQDEFAHQGEMERQIGMETTLFGGPPEIGNVLKLANGQIGFMTIFAHPLFEAVADIMPAMQFAANEISKNKHTWTAKAEQEKRKELIRQETGPLSPRSHSPAAPVRRGAPNVLPETGPGGSTGYFPSSPLKTVSDSIFDRRRSRSSDTYADKPTNSSRRSSLANISNPPSPSLDRESRRSSGAFTGSNLEIRREESRTRSSALRTNSSENDWPSLRGGDGDALPGPEYVRSKQDSVNPFYSPALPHHSSFPFAKNGLKEAYARTSTPPGQQADLSHVLKSASLSSSQDSPVRTYDGGDRDRDTRSSDQHSASACMPSVLSLSNSDASKSVSSVRVDVSNGGSATTKTVPRRRSRIRLAFWRKRAVVEEENGGE